MDVLLNVEQFSLFMTQLGLPGHWSLKSRSNFFVSFLIFYLQFCKVLSLYFQIHPKVCYGSGNFGTL